MGQSSHGEHHDERQPLVDSFTSIFAKILSRCRESVGRSVRRSVDSSPRRRQEPVVDTADGGERLAERKVDGRRRELLEWSGKDGAESLRIFILYGRCFA